MTAPVVYFSTFVCKTSFDKSKNQMRWRITASDIDKDAFDERMSLELFHNFVRRINSNEPIPEKYRSAFYEESGWNGGMPYVSISHYKSGENEINVPGDVEAVYVDGDTLKAKGTFRDTALGRAVFKAINEDMAGVSKFKNPIRVSIGFLDFKHSHGDFVFERKDLNGVCPLCQRGAGNKMYLDGQLVHFAFTRIPANERTSVLLEEKSMDSIKTRKEDAESIVGEDLAEQLEINKSLVAASDTSDVLVIKSESSVDAVQSSQSSENVSTAIAEHPPVTSTDANENSVIKSAIDVALNATTPDEVDSALAALGNIIKSSLAVSSSDNRSEIDTIRSMVERSYDDILRAISDLANRVETISTEMAVLKSSTSAAKISENIPSPRSAIVTERTKSLSSNKLSQIQKIALKSVGQFIE